MKLHYAGRYNGDPNTLANQKMVDGAVVFKEPSAKSFAIISNLFSIALLVAIISIASWRGGPNSFNPIGFLISIVSLAPHEYLHAICFKGDVYLYSYLSKGLLFVVGDEDMSKSRFVFMSMLPNIVFGVLPFMLFLFNPAWTLLGTLGTFALAYGAGDYINVFNALTQMPSKAVTFLHKQNSYWYIPK